MVVHYTAAAPALAVLDTSIPGMTTTIRRRRSEQSDHSCQPGSIQPALFGLAESA